MLINRKYNNSDNNIGYTVTGDLCTGCGTCVSICPNNAIKMIKSADGRYYKPQINKNKCISCGLCLRVCPGYAVDFKNLNLKIFGKESNDHILGNYNQCYIGNSCNYNIRFNAASGGVITALLIFALESGIINGALVTKMNKNRPLEPESFIARTKEEIIEASKSKYCPVPANIALKEIITCKSGEKFAVVGLPCHIHGIRKLELLEPSLKKKIVLHIGIICSHNDTFLQTESLLRTFKISSNDVLKIDYRGQGWPGKMSILLKNGEIVSVPFSQSIAYHKLWLNAIPRCQLCCDLTSELSDISCGDAWLPEVMMSEKIGKSLLITRSKKADEICKSAIRNNYIELDKIDVIKLKQSGCLSTTKKKEIKFHFLLRSLLNKPNPSYNLIFSSGLLNYINGAFISLNVCISSTYTIKFLNKILYMESYLLGLKRK